MKKNDNVFINTSFGANRLKTKHIIQLAGYLSLIDKSISMFSSIWLDEKEDSVSFSDVYKPVALSFNCCASSSVS